MAIFKKPVEFYCLLLEEEEDNGVYVDFPRVSVPYAYTLCHTANYLQWCLVEECTVWLVAMVTDPLTSELSALVLLS